MECYFALVVASYELVCECVSPADSKKAMKFRRANSRAHVLNLGAFANYKQMSAGKHRISKREQKR